MLREVGNTVPLLAPSLQWSWWHCQMFLADLGTHGQAGWWQGGACVLSPKV